MTVAHEEVRYEWTSRAGRSYGLALGCAAPANEPAGVAEVAEAEAQAYTPPAITPASRDLTQADIERMMDELSNWGRWGPVRSRL